MSSLGLLLLSALASGLLAVAIAVLAGASWGWVAVSYIVGGDIGLVMTSLLYYRLRSVRNSELQSD